MNNTVDAHYPFPVAAHTYFVIANRHIEKEKFIRNEVENPQFEYHIRYSKQTIEKRLEAVSVGSNAERSLRLVCASLQLRDDKKYLANFRNANERAYGSPKAAYVQALLSHYGALVKDEARKKLWEEVLQRIDAEVPSERFVGPRRADFLHYRGHLIKYTPLAPSGLSCDQAIQFQLDSVGLSEEGWQVKVHATDEHARTNHKTRVVVVGEQYTPRSQGASTRIAAHEVLGHALRGPQTSIQEAEGVAIMIEQLTDKRFKMRRSYRYLAIALGWGTITTPMTFREVYEVVWRLMVVGGKSVERAKSHAYDECCRAFRGGRPDVAGAVFLKDAVYFDANIRVWEVLAATKLSYNEFVDVIEGRRTLLS